MTLREDQFDLGSRLNSFTVGNGEDASGTIIRPKLHDASPSFPKGNNLPWGRDDKDQKKVHLFLL